MGRQWYDRHDIAHMNAVARERENDLIAIVVELAAALVRMDRNGYQERLLERALKVARVPRERIEQFNMERAERIAARKVAE